MAEDWEKLLATSRQHPHRRGTWRVPGSGGRAVLMYAALWDRHAGNPLSTLEVWIGAECTSQCDTCRGMGEGLLEGAANMVENLTLIPVDRSWRPVAWGALGADGKVGWVGKIRVYHEDLELLYGVFGLVEQALENWGTRR